MSKHHPCLVIGATEMIGFPDWDNLRVKARVDTGAANSSLHVDEVQLLANNNAIITLLDKQFEAPISRKDWVKSANGKEKRLFIRVPIQVGPIITETEINLTNRKGLTFKMLLGRSAMNGLCLVDPSKQYMLKALGG